MQKEKEKVNIVHFVGWWVWQNDSFVHIFGRFWKGRVGLGVGGIKGCGDKEQI